MSLPCRTSAHFKLLSVLTQSHHPERGETREGTPHLSTFLYLGHKASFLLGNNVSTSQLKIHLLPLNFHDGDYCWLMTLLSTIKTPHQKSDYLLGTCVPGTVPGALRAVFNPHHHSPASTIVPIWLQKLRDLFKVSNGYRKRQSQGSNSSPIFVVPTMPLPCHMKKFIPNSQRHFLCHLAGRRRRHSLTFPLVKMC